MNQISSTTDPRTLNSEVPLRPLVITDVWYYPFKTSILPGTDSDRCDDTDNNELRQEKQKERREEKKEERLVCGVMSSATNTNHVRIVDRCDHVLTIAM
jgi:hypothetical protein